MRDVEASDLRIFFEHQLDPEATHMAGFTARDRSSSRARWLATSYVNSGEREVSYWFGRGFWGVATRALAGFLRLEARRPLYANVARHNVASIRVLQKCGFRISCEEPDDLILKLSADETDHERVAERCTG